MDSLLRPILLHFNLVLYISAFLIVTFGIVSVWTFIKEPYKSGRNNEKRNIKTESEITDEQEISNKANLYNTIFLSQNELQAQFNEISYQLTIAHETAHNKEIELENQHISAGKSSQSELSYFPDESTINEKVQYEGLDEYNFNRTQIFRYSKV